MNVPLRKLISANWYPPDHFDGESKKLQTAFTD
jgi:hypothetical protein